MAYTTIVTGTTITSSWANADVRDQVVVPFASTGARSSAITAPVTGQVSTLVTNAPTEGIYQFNSAGDWEIPWNLPWGLVGEASITASFRRSSATLGDATGLSVAVTTVANRRLKVSLSGTWAYVSANVSNCYASLFRDATNLSGAVIGRTGLITTSNQYHGFSGFVEDTGASGTVTYKVQIASDGTNNIDLYAAAGAPVTLLIEDIGPAGAPA